jgi:hypothetical protein
MVVGHLRIIRKNILENLAKDEILAYMKMGMDAREITESLTRSYEEGGIYDFLRHEEGNIFYNSIDWNPIFKEIVTKELIKEIFEKEYWKVIREGCVSFEKIVSETGLSKEDTINLLTVEPLSKWNKLAQKIIAYSKQ